MIKNLFRVNFRYVSPIIKTKSQNLQILGFKQKYQDKNYRYGCLPTPTQSKIYLTLSSLICLKSISKEYWCNCKLDHGFYISYDHKYKLELKLCKLCGRKR